MNLEELKRTIEEYSRIVNTKIGTPLGDAGHKITGLLIVPWSNDNYDLYVIGEDNRSGVDMVKKPLLDWLNDTGTL